MPNPPLYARDQAFPDNERLFRRVHRDNVKAIGKPTSLAFELPDMSVNRERHSSPEDARRGFHKADWGVIALLVSDIPARAEWKHVAHVFRLLPRHVPIKGNHAHSEVRVWKAVEAVLVLITGRADHDFDDHDPD